MAVDDGYTVLATGGLQVNPPDEVADQYEDFLASSHGKEPLEPEDYGPTDPVSEGIWRRTPRPSSEALLQE